MIVLDASALIAHVESRDQHHPSAIELFAALGAVERRASTVTVAEVLVGYVAGQRLEDGEAMLRRLRVVEQPFGTGAAARLATLGAATHLRLPDCCVLLAAQDSGADSIATFDDRLADAARGLGLTVAGA